MARHSFDVQLTRYGEEGWRATFYPAGRGHSVTSAVGSAWEREPWTAVQRAAWESLRKREAEAAQWPPGRHEPSEVTEPRPRALMVEDADSVLGAVREAVGRAG